MFKLFKKKETSGDVPLPPLEMRAKPETDISSIRAPDLFQPYTAPQSTVQVAPLSTGTAAVMEQIQSPPLIPPGTSSQLPDLPSFDIPMQTQESTSTKQASANMTTNATQTGTTFSQPSILQPIAQSLSINPPPSYPSQTSTTPAMTPTNPPPSNQAYALPKFETSTTFPARTPPTKKPSSDAFITIELPEKPNKQEATTLVAFPAQLIQTVKATDYSRTRDATVSRSVVLDSIPSSVSTHSTQNTIASRQKDELPKDDVPIMSTPDDDGWIELIPKKMLDKSAASPAQPSQESTEQKPSTQELTVQDIKIRDTKKLSEQKDTKTTGQQFTSEQQSGLQKQTSSTPAATDEDDDLSLPDFDDLDLDSLELPQEKTTEIKRADTKGLPAIAPPKSPLQLDHPLFVRAFDYIRIMNEKKRIQGLVSQSFRQADEFAKMQDQEMAVLEQWYDLLNRSQEQLIDVDQRLFDKVKA
jgi:hypothetical protein